MRIIRTTNPNSTYRYEIDGELHTKASKTFYSHATIFSNGAIRFHASRFHMIGRKPVGAVKVATVEIIDADPFAPAANLTWHEIDGDSKAFDPSGNLVIHLTVNGANQWCWAIQRRSILASNRNIVDLAAAKREALATYTREFVNH